MTESIRCNYVRTAIRALAQKHASIGTKMPKGALTKLGEECNHMFKDYPQLHLPNTAIMKKFPIILHKFNMKWHPKEQRATYLSTFSTDAWCRLSESEKREHSVTCCKACPRYHPALSAAFPGAKPELLPVIAFREDDIASSTTCARKALSDLNSVCEKHFGVSVEKAIANTPKSKLVVKPSSAERQTQQRKIVKEARKCMQQSMDEASFTMVMKNRISLNVYDRIRKDQALNDTSNRKRKRNTGDEENESPPKQRHGCSIETLQIDTDGLLEEEKSWSPTQAINGSELARKYGVEKSNGGQILKEFLKVHEIPVAVLDQKESRSCRRKRKVLPGGIPFPMPRPIDHLKKQMEEKIEKGEILVGKKVVESAYTKCVVDTASKSITEHTTEFSARKICLSDIRRKLLEKHEQLGIIRNNSDEYFESLCESEIKVSLEVLSQSTDMSVNDSRQKLKQLSRQRFFKIWHDHSTIAGHGHLLITVALLYDPAFYLTAEEFQMKFCKSLDVQSIVEQPEIYILGRSSSSIEHQAMFTECRKEDLLEMSSSLTTSTGVMVKDTMRFFHGDGPTQQFEAGQSIGGNYYCVGCGAKSTMMDDLAYTFRSPKRTLQERQEFMLEDIAWCKGGTNPLEKLKAQELHTELNRRGIDTNGMKKPELEKKFEDLKRGITHVPAILQNDPQAKLESLGLDQYEVSPSEPLHDLKGYLSNLIEETYLMVSGVVFAELKKVRDATLEKATLRCSDYRKALLLIYLKIKELNTEETATLTEISVEQ